MFFGISVVPERLSLSGYDWIYESDDASILRTQMSGLSQLNPFFDRAVRVGLGVLRARRPAVCIRF